MFWETQGLLRRDWLSLGAQTSARAGEGGASGLLSWLAEPPGTHGLGLVGASGLGQQWEMLWGVSDISVSMDVPSRLLFQAFVPVWALPHFG